MNSFIGILSVRMRFLVNVGIAWVNGKFLIPSLCFLRLGEKVKCRESGGIRYKRERHRGRLDLSNFSLNKDRESLS